MKKLFAVFMIVIILTGCNARRQEPPKPQADRQLMQLLENGAQAACDKTAEAPLKKIIAARDILLWIEENRPEYRVIKETVIQFAENYEYGSYVLQTLDNIAGLLKQLEDGKAEELLKNIGMDSENFAVSDRVWENIEKAIDEVKEWGLAKEQ